MTCGLPLWLLQLEKQCLSDLPATIVGLFEVRVWIASGDLITGDAKLYGFIFADRLVIRMPAIQSACKLNGPEALFPLSFSSHIGPASFGCLQYQTPYIITLIIYNDAFLIGGSTRIRAPGEMEYLAAFGDLLAAFFMGMVL